MQTHNPKQTLDEVIKNPTEAHVLAFALIQLLSFFIDNDSETEEQKTEVLNNRLCIAVDAIIKEQKHPQSSSPSKTSFGEGEGKTQCGVGRGELFDILKSNQKNIGKSRAKLIDRLGIEEKDYFDLANLYDFNGTAETRRAVELIILSIFYSLCGSISDRPETFTEKRKKTFLKKTVINMCNLLAGLNLFELDAKLITENVEIVHLKNNRILHPSEEKLKTAIKKITGWSEYLLPHIQGSEFKNENAQPDKLSAIITEYKSTAVERKAPQKSCASIGKWTMGTTVFFTAAVFILKYSFKIAFLASLVTNPIGASIIGGIFLIGLIMWCVGKNGKKKPRDQAKAANNVRIFNEQRDLVSDGRGSDSDSKSHSHSHSHSHSQSGGDVNADGEQAPLLNATAGATTAAAAGR